ncbi:MAG: tetratricopeptide repeat protein [Phycisphaerae bacterium]|nr:tetratricopeptide repeat protein [Phycisphaerae bacterium]
MLVWMRRWLIVGVATMCVASAGCGSPDGAQIAGRDPVSQLPADGADVFSAGGDMEILPHTHLAAGRLHESQSRLGRAAEQYRMAIALKPDFVEALNRLGIVLDGMGRFKEADEAFLKAIEFAPQDAYLYNNLGFSYLSQLRWADAESVLRRAVDIKPDFARGRVNLGLALAQQERYDEALAQFQAALEAEAAYYNIGLMYQSKRRLVEAARAFKTALELNPRMVAARKRLDLLPPDIVSQAERYTATIASPVSEDVAPAIHIEPGERPATQPADEPDDNEPTAEAPKPAGLFVDVPTMLALSVFADMHDEGAFVLDDLGPVWMESESIEWSALCLLPR